jgi:hypothetical protein
VTAGNERDVSRVAGRRHDRPVGETEIAIPTG